MSKASVECLYCGFKWLVSFPYQLVNPQCEQCNESKLLKVREVAEKDENYEY